MSKIVTCVSYHHFADGLSPFTRHLGVTTPPAAFATQLAYFKRHYSPISLAQLLAGDLPDNPLLLTIDDAYRSVLDIAAPLLAQARIPALLMTNPVVLTGGFAPIDNVLSLAMDELGPTGLGLAAGLPNPWTCSLQRIVRELLPSLDASGRAELKQRLLKLLDLTEPQLAARMNLFLTASDVTQLTRRFGFAIGNHTASHMHMRGLAPQTARAEIEDGKRLLEAVTGTRVTAFSFPYGNPLDATPAALDMVRASGHQAIFLVQRRTNSVRPAADIWYRQGMSHEQGYRLPVKLTLLPRMGELKAALN